LYDTVLHILWFNINYCSLHARLCMLKAGNNVTLPWSIAVVMHFKGAAGRAGL